MNISIKRRRLIELYRAILKMNLATNPPPIKIGYALSKNKNKLKEEIEVIGEQEKSMVTDEYEAYTEKRKAICTEFAKKDESGNPVISNNEYIIADQAGFDAKYELLKEEYKDTIDKYDEKVKEFEKFLDDVVEIDLHVININSFPASYDMPLDIVDGIRELLTDEEVKN